MEQDWQKFNIPGLADDSVKEKLELIRLARLGLWASQHGVPALKSAAEQVTWRDEKNQKIILTYGFHIERAQEALAKLPDAKPKDPE
jgi:hypothetical protein